MAFTQNLSKFLIRGIALIARDLRDNRRTLGMLGIRKLFGSRSAAGLIPFQNYWRREERSRKIPGAAE